MHFRSSILVGLRQKCDFLLVLEHILTDSMVIAQPFKQISHNSLLCVD